ncbi:hypothetical protein [Lysinibacillus piscis]|uniref:DUF2798 domain-containing protein n=1 Tax=Lysinibacillus piscis TaxID=2518931 RepID=A0ABQ5NIS0_9BACI|nr:hypothetical protein [Lysinibacillus sp. KH24]GLC88275.1 hypothetical protein LYSBPC_14020 [Lysinibacillus sp. KH24]
MKLQGIVKGLVIGVICASIIPFVFMNIGQSLAGGTVSYLGGTWLYLAIMIPIIIALIGGGYYFSVVHTVSNKTMWWISFAMALIVSLFTGTVGILMAEKILHGNLDTLNVKSIMVAGIIYSVVFLPITVPLGKLILHILYKWVVRR